MPHEFTDSFLTDAIRVLHTYKRLAERAMAQVPENALTIALDAESNSIAIIVKHMVGNMRSRWTDFLTTDGEKPDRNRDTESNRPPQHATNSPPNGKRLEIRFYALASLTDADLGRTVLSATNPTPSRSHQSPDGALLLPCRPNCFLAKHFASAHWTSLTVPRGKSAEATANIRAAQESK